jgi:hypothetical protein
MHDHNTSELRDYGLEGELIQNIAQIYRLVLDAGADFEVENETSHLFSGFGWVVAWESSVSSNYHAATFLVLD